ncbi:MAG: hypothetical protein QXT42_04185 [Thermoplasmata archaeon]
MAEKLVGVIQDVLLGPWYGEVYDLLSTDRRFLLLYLQKLKTSYTLEARDLSRLTRESIDVLASSTRSISIEYADVRSIRQREGPIDGSHYLILRYQTDEGKLRKVKLLLLPQKVPTIHLAGRKDGETKLVPVERGYDEGIDLLLSRAIPGISIES